MNAQEALDLLPDTKGCLVILSGGMDSTIAMRLAVEKYGNENVQALSFDYNQKQRIELNCARISSMQLLVGWKLLDLKILGDISQGFSANVDKNIEMPKIQDILGDPRPKTYVPNRNMILMSIAASYAETKGIDTVIMGIQAHDLYNYHDTTQRFIDKVNNVLAENRIIKIKIITPFSSLTKTEELNILKELDGNLNLTKLTLTCYNPTISSETFYNSIVYGESCGVCPSCAERLKAFKNVGEKDLIPYVRDSR